MALGGLIAEISFAEGMPLAGNELLPGQSRIGFAWDSDVTQPYAAMLRDRNGRIELVIPYDSSDEVLKRRYIGNWVKWGDDPDMSAHNYHCRSHSGSATPTAS